MNRHPSDLWKEKVLDLLDQRDTYENLSLEYFHSFRILLDRTFTAESAIRTEISTPQSTPQLLALISALKRDNQNLVLNYQKLSFTNNNLASSIKNLKKSLNFKIEENLMKNNALNLINDELISLQIQNNLLQDKISKLESENETLVGRWIDKVRDDADRINDANDFLQNYKSFTKRSP